jgi:hypothetical protein
MAAINFPSSPSNGTTHTANNVTWTFESAKGVWRATTFTDAPTGAKGQKGEKGQKGQTGGTGAKGQKGQKGEVGLTGAKGQKGQKGEVGLTGDKGQKGQKGEVGLTGDKGQKGQKGEVGVTGAKGDKGEVGAKGQQGQKGEVGATGSKGQKGEIGQFGGGSLDITNGGLFSNASSNWTGDPGTKGKIQYHSNRWYIVGDSSSNRIVQFRRNATDVSYIANDGTFNGTATSANWSDLAEKYLADKGYEHGDLLAVGGEKEVTLYKRGMAIAGVISTRPGVRMNVNEDNMEDPLWPFIALKGRIPCKINGTAQKGDYIVADDNGKCKALPTDSIAAMPMNFSNFVGVALEDGEGLVEVKV